MSDEHDPVRHPKHYAFTIQPLDAIEAWNLGYHAGNVVKYLARAPHKGAELEDLRKAAEYLRRLIALREKAARDADQVPSPCYASLTDTAFGVRVYRCRLEAGHFEDQHVDGTLSWSDYAPGAVSHAEALRNMGRTP